MSKYKNDSKNRKTKLVGYEFIGFAYGDREPSEELINFAKQFDKPKLIQGLTDTWGSKANSIVADL